MQEPYSHLYNAVILPAGPSQSAEEPRFQVSASRNDRGTPRFLSPLWTLDTLRYAFRQMGTSEVEFQELLRGNRRGAGGRDARRILFTAGQLRGAGLTQEQLREQTPQEPGHPTAGEHAVFPAD